MDYDCDYCVHCLMNEETEEEFCDILLLRTTSVKDLNITKKID